MRKYDSTTEENVRTERLVREWTRSGLLNADQCNEVVKGLHIDLRRTNVFLQIILFGFTTLIITASVFLIENWMNVRKGSENAAVCFVAAIATFVLAEQIVDRFRFYRFGIEEAAAVCSIVLTAFAARSLFDQSNVMAYSAGAAAAFVVYLRFGYVYAALGSVLCVSAIPFQFGASDSTSRFLAAVVVASIWFVARSSHRRFGDEFPGDEQGFIEAVTWIVIYGFLNLHLINLFGRVSTVAVTTPTFYWFSYAMIWLLPAVGLYLSVKDKNRAMLDVNIAMVLVTLMTNKPYLHGIRQSWDPIVFGLLLIGVAVVLRRWLGRGAQGTRNGFIAARILSSERRGIQSLGAVSVLIQPNLPQPSSPSQDTFQGGGGRSGGAGASGSF